MSDIDPPESPLPTIGTVIVGFISAAVLTFCSPAPAFALTEQQCTVHAQFAYGLLAPEVSEEQVTQLALAHPDDRPFFVMLLQAARVAIAEGVSAATFGNLVLSTCLDAVEEETL